MTDDNVVDLLQPEPHASLTITWCRQGAKLSYTLEVEDEAADPVWLADQLKQIGEQIGTEGFDWSTDE